MRKTELDKEINYVEQRLNLKHENLVSVLDYFTHKEAVNMGIQVSDQSPFSLFVVTEYCKEGK
jgi:hypothetical protein